MPVSVNGKTESISFFIIQSKGPALTVGYPYLRDRNLLVDIKKKRLMQLQNNSEVIECRLHDVVSPKTNKKVPKEW